MNVMRRTAGQAIIKPVQTFLLGMLALMVLVCGGSAAPLVAYEARIAGDDARTRIILDFDRKPEFSLHYLTGPARIIVELPETSFGFPDDQLKARGLFSDIRYGAMGQGHARLVLTSARPVAMVLTDVQEVEGGKGFRLILDAAITTDKRFAELVAAQSWKTDSTKSVRPVEPAKPGDYLIAVDAGHGGIDTGALGFATKTEEKHVTLDFSRQLVDALNRQEGVKAFLTREKDEFLSLPQRVQLAREARASLFISIHADTVRQKDIRGATVYTISDRASDSLAANLAARENLSDQLAGVAMESEPPEVADILLDLTRRETQVFSINLARSIVESFEGQVNLINNPHRHAGFRVLQAPDIPSVLLELGFMSNKDDEKLLLDAEWRAKVADLVSNAVRKYRAPVVANGG